MSWSRSGADGGLAARGAARDDQQQGEANRADGAMQTLHSSSKARARAPSVGRAARPR